MAGISPFDWGTAKNALADWITDQLGLPIHWEGQDAPRPDYPYVSLDIMAGPTKTGEDEQRWVDEAAPGTGVKVINVGDRIVTISAQVYVSFEGTAYDHDNDAMAKASVLEASLMLDATHAALRDAGFTVQQTLPIRDLTGSVEAGWISRAVFDFICGLAFVVDPGSYSASINTVRISGELEGQAGAGDPLDFTDADFGG